MLAFELFALVAVVEEFEVALAVESDEFAFMLDELAFVPDADVFELMFVFVLFAVEEPDELEPVFAVALSLKISCTAFVVVPSI